jgi:leader peptidase (prepilin peptidase)/N-methyltransferase
MGEFINMLHSDFMEPQFYVMFYTVVFLFGICIGSFLNVVILRLPRQESLIKRASHCMTCGAKIRACDLIPVFSWIFLRGKCHNCGEKISPRYPIVESLNGIMYVLTFTVMDFNAESIIACVVMSLLIVVAFMDWDTLEIDLRILALILLMAILSAILTDTLTITDRIIGAFCISLPFFAIGEISRIYIRKKKGEDYRGIELGDTLLMAVAGAFLGTRAVIVSALAGILIAAIGGLIYKKVTGESKFAFGPYLSIGIAIGILWGNNIAQWYIELLKAPLQQ